MAETKAGTVIHRRDLSSVLSIFRIVPEEGNNFPVYKAGQYIALRRDDCRLTKRIIGANGTIDYVPDLDARQFQLLLQASKAQAFYELKQVENPKAEKKERKNTILAQRTKANVRLTNAFDAAPKFGRK